MLSTHFLLFNFYFFSLSFDNNKSQTTTSQWKGDIFLKHMTKKMLEIVWKFFLENYLKKKKNIF